MTEEGPRQPPQYSGIRRALLDPGPSGRDLGISSAVSDEPREKGLQGPCPVADLVLLGITDLGKRAAVDIEYRVVAESAFSPPPGGDRAVQFPMCHELVAFRCDEGDCGPEPCCPETLALEPPQQECGTLSS